MRNVLGENLTLALFGESHGEYIGATLDGFPSGNKVDLNSIKLALEKRRPIEGLDTPRIEDDDFKIISGVFNGYSTGAPITILIKNKNIDNNVYNALKDVPRPGHVDYVANEKYNGYQDYRGGGHFSGRLTAPIVAIAAIVLDALKEKGIYIGTHIYRCGEFVDKQMVSINDIDAVNIKRIPTLTDEENLTVQIEKVQKENDSIGGVTETLILGMPVGIGEPIFSSIESNISKAIFSVGGIKGIEFGEGFNFASLKGSEANDAFIYKDDKVITLTNHNGGVNGGISNGMPIIFRCVIKPTSSIAKKQQSVNMNTKENVELEINGRHDPAIVRRVPIVITSLTAIALLDLLLIRFGEDYLKK